MFSIKPSTGTESLSNMRMALTESSIATVLGVVTITAPVTTVCWMSESWTSPVPGGRSTTR
jgi:hypothetical protein